MSAKCTRSSLIVLFCAAASCTEPETISQSRTKTGSTQSDGKTIVLDSSSGAQGTTIFIPGSASEIDAAAIELEDAPADVAKHTTAAYLNLPGQVTPAGTPILITYTHSPTHNQAGSLILTLPLQSNGAALTSSSQNLVVFYEIFTDSSDKTLLGVIPTSDLNLSQSSVSFALRGFGIYQAAYLSEPVSSERTATNDGTVITRNDQKTVVRRKIETAESSTSTSSDGGSTTGTTSSTGGSDSNSNLAQGWNPIDENAFGLTSSTSHDFKIAISPNGGWLAIARAENPGGYLKLKRISLLTQQSTTFDLGPNEPLLTIGRFELSIDDSGNTAAIVTSINMASPSASLHLFTLSNSNIEAIAAVPRTSVDADYYSLANHGSAGMISISRERVSLSSLGGDQALPTCETYSFSIEGTNITYSPISQHFVPGSQMLCGGRQLRTATSLIVAVPVDSGHDQSSIAIVSIAQEQFATPTIQPLGSWTLTDVAGSSNFDPLESKIFLTSGADGMTMFALQGPNATNDPGTNFVGGVKASTVTNLIVMPEQFTTALIPIQLQLGEGGGGYYYMASDFFCTATGCQLQDGNDVNATVVTYGMTADNMGFQLVGFPGGHTLINLRSGKATTRNPATGAWSAVQSIDQYSLIQNSTFAVHSAASATGYVALAARHPTSGAVAEGLEPVKIFVFKP